jgi:hypothetical protein
MSAVGNFRDELQEAVDARHQANHPFIDKWAEGQLSRDAITGASCEIWHWISNLLPEALFNICAKSPQDVIDMEMENLEEETDPENPHERLMIRFIEACGVSEDDLSQRRNPGSIGNFAPLAINPGTLRLPGSTSPARRRSPGFSCVYCRRYVKPTSFPNMIWSSFGSTPKPMSSMVAGPSKCW